MLENVRSIVQLAEAEAATGDVNGVLRILRKLCLWDFGEVLWGMPDAEFPHLSRVLPRMASPEVQQGWTGAVGNHLLHLSVDFCRMAHVHFERIARRPLHRARVLDYGCGYGRFARLMYWFADPEDFVGVDPSDESIKICRQDRLLGTIAKSEFLPDTLPVGERKFDLIFAYSVFTHTSVKATQHALRAMRKCIHSSGLLIITVRPFDYWSHVQHIDNFTEEQRQHYINEHRTRGYSFWPNPYIVAGGESVFGETTIDPGWIAREFPDWRLEGYDRGHDPWQKLLLLSPA